jgi:hypothetical protein
MIKFKNKINIFFRIIQHILSIMLEEISLDSINNGCLSQENEPNMENKEISESNTVHPRT